MRTSGKIFDINFKNFVKSYSTIHGNTYGKLLIFVKLYENKNNCL